MKVSPKILLVLASLILSVLIGVSLSARQNGTSRIYDDEGLVIGMSMDTLKEARWQRDRDIFVKRAEELGAKVLVQSANSDDTRQIQQVMSLIANKVKVLVIVPHDGTAMAKAVEEAGKASIPVIAFDRLITDCDLDLYLSFDNIKVGEQQAGYLVEKLNGKGRIIRIYGAPTDNNAKLFKQGQDNVLKPYIERGAITVVHEDWVENWDPGNAKKIMNAALTTLGDTFDAVLASNDGTAGGAIQALKEAKLDGKRLVTGQDADLVACQRIVAGSQSMTVYKPIKELATTAAELAVKFGSGKPIVANGAVPNGRMDVPSVLLPTIVVDRVNIQEVIVNDGFHSKKDLFGEASGE